MRNPQRDRLLFLGCLADYRIFFFCLEHFRLRYYFEFRLLFLDPKLYYNHLQRQTKI